MDESNRLYFKTLFKNLCFHKKAYISGLKSQYKLANYRRKQNGLKCKELRNKGRDFVVKRGLELQSELEFLSGEILLFSKPVLNNENVDWRIDEWKKICDNIKENKQCKELEEKLMQEKRVMYNHNVDMRGYKWSGKSILKKIDLDQLPKFISSNIDSYKEWLD